MNPDLFWGAIKRMGTDFTLQRSGSQPTVIRGCLKREEGYIGFLPETGILRGDVLLNPAGDKFFVVDVQTQFEQNVAMQVMAYYQTERERNAMERGGGMTVNAHNVIMGNGSQSIDYGNAVVGNQGAVNYAPDNSTVNELNELLAPHEKEYKEDVARLRSIVQEIESGAIIVKKGVFSPVKAFLTLFPKIKGFLKGKFPKAFDGDAP